MTVENVTPLIRYPYTGPGAYSFSFLIYDEDDLTITHTDVYGNRTVLTITTDYTVTINSGSPGGSVTMIYSETTGAIEIARVLDYTQTTAWENEGALDMQLLEQDFDRTVMLLQQLKSEFYRAPAQAKLRGSWATATAYVQGDVVWDSTDEIFYACYADHTSGTLATDVALGYWFESLDLTSVYADAINAAVAMAVALKADLASPALTGVPTAPTATAGTSTTQIATTAFVIANNSTVGAIIAWPTGTAPTGYLECNGAAINRTTYATLFGIISDDYGAGDGLTTFNLPDYRGEFLRGWDHAASNDPDSATRTDRGDGTIGDYVGTKQTDAFEAHTHTVNRFLSANAANGTDDYGLSGTQNTGSTGGNETRPRNVNVMYCIKY